MSEWTIKLMFDHKSRSLFGGMMCGMQQQKPSEGLVYEKMKERKQQYIGQVTIASQLSYEF